MATDFTIPHRHLPQAAPWLSVLSTLGTAWAAHTLKRAIVDVSSTSDRAYRDFGFDKAEILAALGRVRDHVTQ